MNIPPKGAFGKRRTGLTETLRALHNQDVVEVPRYWEGCHAVAKRLGLEVATRRIAYTDGTERVLVFRRVDSLRAPERDAELEGK
jgi:hypothetical protein